MASAALRDWQRLREAYTLGRYRELQDYLAAREGIVRLSLAEIEALVGPLPASARAYHQWWSNSDSNRSQARAWLRAGYVVSSVDFRAETVEFYPEGTTSRRTRDPAHQARAAGTSDAPAHSVTEEPSVPSWRRVFNDVADRLAEHVEAGLEHLLTEDLVRWELIWSLLRSGVDPNRLRIEHRRPEIAAKFDLALTNPLTSVVELKYPRDPSNSGAADTMTTGELLRDFYRLAWTELEDAWALHVIQPRLLKHLQRRTELSYKTAPGDVIELPARLRDTLPATAAAGLPEWTLPMAVSATCRFRKPAGDLLVLGYKIGPSAFV